MNVNVISAEMKQEEDQTYLGRVVFGLEGHQSRYEITFFSKKGREWDYSLHFADQPGDEEEMLKVDTMIEEDDEMFDRLLDAALDSMEQ